MPLLTVIENENKIYVECEVNENLYKAIIKAGIFIDAPCGGVGKCGKCIVKASGMISKPEENAKHLTDRQIADGYTLACKTLILGDATVIIEKKGNIEIETNIKDVKAGKLKVFDKENPVGAAVDIGTTTVAVFFYDLKTFKHITTVAQMNRQKKYGADVMKRIEYADLGQEQAKSLHNVIIEQLNGMFLQGSAEGGFEVSDISDIVVTGNTVMLSLFADCSVSSLGKAPYLPVEYFGKEVKACDLGLNADGRTMVYIMPIISGFLGGDMVAVMLSLDFDKRDDSVFCVDIGTNGEMAVLHKNNIFACSTAAGPAFEGAEIECGMASMPGAIYKVEYADDKFKVKTIGNKKAEGICGSGLIDLCSALKDNCMIDENGTFEYDHKAYNGEQKRINITDGVFITQRDIRQIQLAKAAICAGCIVLANVSMVGIENIEKVYIAGGFGSAIPTQAADNIGILPKNLFNKAEVIGNAAGTGAVMCLLDYNNRVRAEEISKKTQTVLLNANKDFENEFVENMLF